MPLKMKRFNHRCARLGVESGNGGGVEEWIGGICYSNAALADGTTNGKAKTVNAVDYAIDGVLYSKAGTDDLFNCVGLDDVGAAKACTVVFLLDSTGTASVVKGDDADAVADVTYPDIPATKCVIGVIVVDNTGGGVDYVFGSGALSAKADYYNGCPSDAMWETAG